MQWKHIFYEQAAWRNENASLSRTSLYLLPPLDEAGGDNLFYDGVKMLQPRGVFGKGQGDALVEELFFAWSEFKD